MGVGGEGWVYVVRGGCGWWVVRSGCEYWGCGCEWFRVGRLVLGLGVGERLRLGELGELECGLR